MQIRSHLTGMLYHIPVCQLGNERKCSGGSQGVSSKGRCMIARLEHCNPLFCQQCPNWKTAAQPLCQGNCIRFDLVVLVGEQGSCAAKSALYFVKQQQRIGFAAYTADFLQVLLPGWENPPFPLNRF